MFLGRKARNHLEVLLTAPSQLKPSHETANTGTKKFKTGDRVLVRDYRNPNKLGWMAGKVTQVWGKRHCLCELPSGQMRKCHYDQMRPRHFNVKITRWNEPGPTSSAEEALKTRTGHTSSSVAEENLMTTIWAGSTVPNVSANHSTTESPVPRAPPYTATQASRDTQTTEQQEDEPLTPTSINTSKSEGQATAQTEGTEHAENEGRSSTPTPRDNERQRSFAEVVRASLTEGVNRSLNETAYFDPQANSSMVQQPVIVQQYPPCPVCQGETREHDMVQCDACDRWVHYECVGVGDSVANRSWVCPMCGGDNNSAITVSSESSDHGANELDEPNAESGSSSLDTTSSSEPSS